jgi:hypothetical protein
VTETGTAPTNPEIALDIKLSLFIHRCLVSIDAFGKTGVPACPLLRHALIESGHIDAGRTIAEERGERARR